MTEDELRNEQIKFRAASVSRLSSAMLILAVMAPLLGMVLGRAENWVGVFVAMALFGLAGFGLQRLAWRILGGLK